MKFSAVIVALIASTSQVEGAKLHSLQRTQAKAQLEAMSEQMELLQEQMDVNQKNMADTQAWWDTLYDDAQKLFWDWPLILRLENWIETEGSVLRKQRARHFQEFKSFFTIKWWNLDVIFGCFFFVFDSELNCQYYNLIVH